MFVFFFLKQKTAYEITYGDWSSDVCSSDLEVCGLVQGSIQNVVSPAVRAPAARNAVLTLRRNFLIKQRLQHRLELVDPARQFGDRLSVGGGSLAVCERLEACIRTAHNAPRHAHHGRMIGDRPHDDRTSADLHVIADADVAQDLRTGAYDHAITDCGVPLPRIFARSA